MIIIFSFSWIFGPYEPVALNKTLRCRVFNRKELKQCTEAETNKKVDQNLPQDKISVVRNINITNREINNVTKAVANMEVMMYPYDNQMGQSIQEWTK